MERRDDEWVPPVLIQGGMGVGVSGWRLARAVSTAGHLGVVSGTALDSVFVRRLQLGDPDREVRRALAAFPKAGVADRLLDRYFVEGGKEPDRRFRSAPMPSIAPSETLLDLLVAANFVEVFLAKSGHGNAVGINYLEKIQAPTLPSLYGAMLAGVDVIIIGAGIPRAIPGILDALASGRKADLRIDVTGAAEAVRAFFDPSEWWGSPAPRITRPRFFPIVSSHVLATMLARRTAGGIQGFVVEGPTAGGHNAPPRSKEVGLEGEPVYGDRDIPDLDAIGDLGVPFWLAGSYGRPDGLAAAQELGAAGIQVGTAFAFCEESDLDPDLKRKVLDSSRRGELGVKTDARGSPTGFPFKLVQLPGTLSDPSVERTRVCDLGYLRSAYVEKDGSIGWRCASEPVEDYVRKGGDEEDTVGRRCLCNALFSNIGLAAVRPGGTDEMPLLTAGDDAADVARFLPPGADTYSAAHVIRVLVGE